MRDRLRSVRPCDWSARGSGAIFPIGNVRVTCEPRSVTGAAARVVFGGRMLDGNRGAILEQAATKLDDMRRFL